MELYSVYASQDGRGVWGENGYMYMYGRVPWLFTWKISYTLLQNKQFKVRKKKNLWAESFAFCLFGIYKVFRSCCGQFMPFLLLAALVVLVRLGRPSCQVRNQRGVALTPTWSLMGIRSISGPLVVRWLPAYLPVLISSCSHRFLHFL